MPADIFSFINKIISEINNRNQTLYDQSISRLNTSITLFSVSLGIFALLVGFFSFNKLKDIKNLLDKIEASPEIMINTYYHKQISLLSNNLFNSNNLIRSETIKQFIHKPNVENRKL
jgi:hypothetical protein